MNNVYKLGQTENFNRRFAQYKNHKPYVILQYKCSDYITHEVNLLKLFNDNFNKLKDRGSEYFNGNVDKMKYTIIEYFKNNLLITLNNITN